MSRGASQRFATRSRRLRVGSCGRRRDCLEDLIASRRDGKVRVRPVDRTVYERPNTTCSSVLGTRRGRYRSSKGGEHTNRRDANNFSARSPRTGREIRPPVRETASKSCTTSKTTGTRVHVRPRTVSNGSRR